MEMLKSKIKGIVRKALVRGFNLFEGTGIGKIPGVLRLFTHLSRTFNLRMVREVGGWEFNIRASPQAVLYFSERFEPNVTNLYCSLLKEGMTVADVGAATGYYTLLASKIVGSTGFVLSFEPDFDRFREMVDNIQINKCNNVEPFERAISDKEGTSKFEEVDAFGSGCVVKARKDAKRIITLKTITLDSFKNNFDIVKIDVEGGELEVLRGMKNILAKGKVKIICEVHPDQLSSLGYSTEEIEKLLQQYDFGIYIIKEKNEKLVSCHDLDDRERRHYLFTREEVQIDEEK